MSTGQRKNSRTRTKSGTARTKAKNKTRRSPSKALARTAEHVKKSDKAARHPTAAPCGKWIGWTRSECDL